MARRMMPARRPQGVPNVQSMEYNTGQAIVKGSVVVFSSNKLNLAGADPTPIVGVSLEGAGTKPGFEPANDSQTDVYTGRVQEVSVAIADGETVFMATGYDGSAEHAPATANMGVAYGIVNVSGKWLIDETDTTNTRVTIVDIDTSEDIWFFKFLQAHWAF